MKWKTKFLVKWKKGEKKKKKILLDQLTVWQESRHFATSCQTKYDGETESNKLQ